MAKKKGRRLAQDRLAEAYDRALALEKAGRRAEAAKAWRAVLRLDPEDHGGAAVRLAALGAAETPGRAPAAYVRTLFDQHAERFDDILVERLGYRVPWTMRRMVEAEGLAPPARLLDLGCGTGLVGEAFRGFARHVSGLDLSEEMLGLAWDRGAYDELYVGDALAFLEADAKAEDEDDGADAAPWDLVTAADVLPYLGDTGPLFAAVARNLLPRGHFLFSTETQSSNAFAGRGYMVGPKQRFAHAEQWLRTALSEAGFTVVRIEPITVRHEEGAQVTGQLLLARLR